MALLAAQLFPGLLPAAAETRQYEIIDRWVTDNKTLRPVTFDGTVLYLAGEATIEAWDVGEGKRIWKQPLDLPANFRPRLAGDNILAIGRESISAWDRKTGQQRWNFQPKGQIGAPYYHDGRIFLGIGQLLTAIDADSGEIIWSRSILVKDGIGGIWYAPTSYGKDTILFGPGDGFLYSFAAATGDLNWKVNQAKKWQYLRQLYISGDTLVAGGYLDNIFGIDPATGKIKWDWYSGNFINSHLVYDGAAYFWSPTGWIYSMNASTGKRNWRTKSDYFPRKGGAKTPWAPVLAEQVADENGLYVLDMKSVLHILDHDSGVETASIKFGERLRPFLALEPGTRRMFLGNNKGEILYVELK